MEGKITKKQLLKNWACSYVGNFVGSLFLAYLVYKSGTLGTSPAAVNIATAKCGAPFDVAFYRGILCNWLVCMAVYMASGSSTMIGKMSKYKKDNKKTTRKPFLKTDLVRRSFSDLSFRFCIPSQPPSGSNS